MRVIVKGRPIRIECRFCGSELQVKPKEVKRDFGSDVIKCPVCKRKIYTLIHSGEQI